jgi:hypothetical protein
MNQNQIDPKFVERCHFSFKGPLNLASPAKFNFLAD